MIEAISCDYETVQLNITKSDLLFPREQPGSYEVQQFTITNGPAKGRVCAYIRYSSYEDELCEALELPLNWQVIKVDAWNNQAHKQLVTSYERALMLAMACAYELSANV